MGVAVTALAGFSPTNQAAQAGLFDRLRSHFHGNCCTCSGEYVSSCAVASCSVPVATCNYYSTCAIAAPCGGCVQICDVDYDDDCDDDCDD
jgi:hypothetical protein